MRKWIKVALLFRQQNYAQLNNLEQWFSTFLARGTLKYENNLAAHFCLESFFKTTKKM
jgi:hypothetical protein